MKRRQTIRRRGYDYRTPGAYFVTICTHERAWLFMELALAAIVRDTWVALPERFPTITLDEFIVMPNHVHLVVWLCASGVGTGPPPTLGAVVGAFKSLVARDWLRWVNANDPHRPARVWQRNYYERIVRDDHELAQIRAYIRTNPDRWREDRDNLDALIARMTEHPAPPRPQP